MEAYITLRMVIATYALAELVMIEANAGILLPANELTIIPGLILHLKQPEHLVCMLSILELLIKVNPHTFDHFFESSLYPNSDPRNVFLTSQPLRSWCVTPHNQHCVHIEHVYFETYRHNQVIRKGNHSGRYGCWCPRPCIGENVKLRRLTEHEKVHGQQKGVVPV